MAWRGDDLFEARHNLSQCDVYACKKTHEKKSRVRCTVYKKPTWGLSECGDVSDFLTAGGEDVGVVEVCCQEGMSAVWPWGRLDKEGIW